MLNPTSSNTVVSFDDELLIAVDPEDNVRGYPSKAEAHMGSGTLHRAFSIFLFSDNNEVLLQKRSKTKLLWPEYWSNSCCSHPRKGEELQQAALRRLTEELGCRASLEFVYRFMYHARYLDIGSEHELCSVYVGTTSDFIRPNDQEVDDHQWIDYQALDSWTQDEPGLFTPWFKSEWQLMRSGTLRNELSGLGINSPSP
jgi:isopentenyl-diphosphate delta-isomerase